MNQNLNTVVQFIYYSITVRDLFISCTAMQHAHTYVVLVPCGLFSFLLYVDKAIISHISYILHFFTLGVVVVDVAYWYYVASIILQRCGWDITG